MAYGGLMGQKPESGPPSNGLPTNDVRQLVIKDGENINAGDVVDADVDGVYKNLTPQKNVETTFSSYISTQTSICKLRPDTAIVFYRPASSNGSVNVLTLSEDNSISIGKESSFSANISDNNDIVRLGDNRAICFYYESTNEYMGLRLIDVSGTICTFGTENTLVRYAGSGKLIPISENQCAIFYAYGSNGAKIYAKMLTIDGNTIKQGNQYDLGDVVAGAVSINATRLPDGDNGDKRVCVCFTHSNDKNKGKAVIATIDSSNAITFGDVVTFESNSIYQNNYKISCCENNGDVVVLYSVGGNTVSKVLSISNNSIIPNPYTVITNEATKYSSISFDGKNIFVAYSLQSAGEACVLTRSENSLIVGKQYQFTNIASTYLSTVDIEENKFIIAYRAGSTEKGNTTILSVRGNQIAGSFINTSKTAIALQSGTSGQTIPVGFGGYCACDGVTAGQSINSTGVMAYAPLNGWLDIRPEYSKEFTWEILIDENFKGTVDSSSFYTVKEYFLSSINLSNYALLRIKTSIGPETSGNYILQLNNVDISKLEPTVGKTYSVVFANSFDEFHDSNDTRYSFNSNSSLNIKNGSRQKYDFNIKVFGFKF